jgi:hypothetical protein
MRTPTTVVLAFVASLAAFEAGAAVLYKLTTIDGQVTYVDVVPKGFAGSIQRLDIYVDPTPIAAPRAPVARPAPAAREETENERIIRRRTDTNAGAARLTAARARVDSARSVLKEAQDNPLATDWIQIAKGADSAGGRRYPAPEYLERLTQLEAAVQSAQESLKDVEREERSP